MIFFSENSRLYIFYNKKVDLTGCIAFNDDYNIGFSALGGTRLVEYSSIEDCIDDAKKLSISMTKKCILAEVPYIGGKCTIIKPKNLTDSEQFFKAYGEIVEELKGKFITGCDVGISGNDMNIVNSKTKYITGLSNNLDKDYLSYLTALGVVVSIKTSLHELYNIDNLAGLNIVVQGVGKVGKSIAEILSLEKANIIICDIYSDTVDKLASLLGCKSVAPENIYDVNCDVFVPCGLGGSINQDTLKRLNCKLICGAANNQIIDQSVYKLLDNRGIMFIPDWISNIGGTIYAAHSYVKDDLNKITNKVHHVLSKRTKEFLDLRSVNNFDLNKTVNTFLSTLNYHFLDNN